MRFETKAGAEIVAEPKTRKPSEAERDRDRLIYNEYLRTGGDVPRVAEVFQCHRATIYRRLKCLPDAVKNGLAREHDARVRARRGIVVDMLLE